jgi:hypothetical protein
MMDARSLAFTASAVAVLSFVGVARWRNAIPSEAVRPFAFGHAVSASSDSVDDILGDAEEMTASNDPFRLANAPSSVRFDPNTENGASSSTAATTASVRPNLTLKAIVGGPPWQAVVDGIPGQPSGAIVRAGSVFDKLVARDVTRDSVIIKGPDTTWTLSFQRRP